MERSFSLTPGKRVLYLTKDPEKIRRQLDGSLTLRMSDLSPDELLDDINTDAMTPAWVCFDFDPKEIAKNAYAGLIVDGQRLIPPNAIADGRLRGDRRRAPRRASAARASRRPSARCSRAAGSRSRRRSRRSTRATTSTSAS